MSNSQSYPPYGKPQSTWQPGQDETTSSFNDPYAPKSTQEYQASNGYTYHPASSTAEMPTYGSVANTAEIPMPNAAGTTSEIPPTYGAANVPPAYQPSHARYATEPGQAVSAYQTQPAKGGALKSFLVSFAGAALACVLAVGIGLGTGFVKINTPTTTANPTGTSLGASTSTTISAAEDETLAEVVAAKALPSVVSINVYTQGSSGYSLGHSSSNSSTLQESSLGSGVVLTQDGYIITNYHVVDGGDAFKVMIGGEEYDADYIGSDASSDIAVIKARNASGLTPIELGNSDNLTVGEWVMSIGSPFGLEQSVATGVVSATSRSQIYDDSSSNGYGSRGSSYTLYVNMIQTDAAINPGNSGGALVNKNGQLIGINTLITSYSGNYSGVGFAIPANYAINLAQQIINGETPTHAQLGVTLSTVTPSNASRYGLAVDKGAYVSSVSRGSGADAAGIEQGDIITKFGATTITSASDLMLAVRAYNPGDTVEVEINRDGKTATVKVTLGSDAQSSAESANTQQNSGSTFPFNMFNNGGSSR